MNWKKPKEMPEKTRAEIVRERRPGAKRTAEPVVLMKRKEEPVPSAKSDRKTGRKGGFDARWISGPLALILAAAIGWYAYAPDFRVRTVNVQGMDSLNQEELMYYGKLSGRPVFMLDPEESAKTIRTRFEMVRDAEVRVSFPAQVDVLLDERIPMVEWDFGGSRFWIDQDGNVMENAFPRADTVHIIANAYPGGKDEKDRDVPIRFSSDTLQSMLTFGKKVPEGKTLYYTYAHGYGWDSEQGWRLFFGHTDTDLDEKLQMAESITKYLLEEEIQPVLLSLEFKDAPFYRFSE